jgi:site-specific recombinase XerC
MQPKGDDGSPTCAALLSPHDHGFEHQGYSRANGQHGNGLQPQTTESAGRQAVARETELVLRKTDNESLCSLRHYLLLQRRAKELGTYGSLFCSEDGKPYAQSVQRSRLLRQLLRRAGIDCEYPAHSIHHALITALFDAGLSESQVNTYTGHSNNAHIAATSYFHLNSK